MKNIKIGVLLGLLFGIIDALLMLPIPMADKTVAIVGASINRFAIGLFIPITILPRQGWLRGIMIGLLLSLPDAIITHTYAPIIIVGIIGGALLGLLSDKLTTK